MPWKIEPYLGAGQIKLGMTALEVEKEIGPPDDSRSSRVFVKKEFRDLELPTISYEETGVAEITFSRRARLVSLFNIDDVFSEDPIYVLKEIEIQDASLRESMGIIVSLRLGISLSGFHDNDEDQKTITVFRKGLWDKRLDQSKPFNI